jgi:hypothetical protein
MATPKVNFTQLTHEVVQSSPEPLPFAEIMARVNNITPITTKNPKNTLRNVISQSQLLVSTGDGRFGWKPRLINNARIRHTIQAAELAQNQLYYDDDLRDALCPTFFAIQKHKDRSPVHVALPNGETAVFPLTMFSRGIWGTPADATFWDWFHSLAAAPGDHLLFEVVDGEAKQYRVLFQPRADRDEAAIAARNRELVAIGQKLTQQRSYGLADWEFTTHLLATGFYHHPIPPDPFNELWRGDMITSILYGDEPLVPQSKPDPLGSAFFGQSAQTYDLENPPDLPREYDPDNGRRHARQSRKARTGSVTSYLLRVNHRAMPEVWRDIELAEDNTLEDLHLTIQSVFRWMDDHLYSFYLSGDQRDSQSEIGSPWSDTAVHTHQIEMAHLNLQEGQIFLYLFDYGDNHEFDVTVLTINPLAPKADYPRIVTYQGTPPPQYPDIDEKTGQMSWDPYRHRYST